MTPTPMFAGFTFATERVFRRILVSLRFATRMMKTTHGGLGTNVAEAF